MRGNHRAWGCRPPAPTGWLWSCATPHRTGVAGSGPTATTVPRIRSWPSIPGGSSIPVRSLSEGTATRAPPRASTWLPASAPSTSAPETATPIRSGAPPARPGTVAGSNSVWRPPLLTRTGTGACGSIAASTIGRASPGARSSTRTARPGWRSSTQRRTPSAPASSRTSSSSTSSMIANAERWRRCGLRMPPIPRSMNAAGAGIATTSWRSISAAEGVDSSSVSGTSPTSQLSSSVPAWSVPTSPSVRARPAASASSRVTRWTSEPVSRTSRVWIAPMVARTTGAWTGSPLLATKRIGARRTGCTARREAWLRDLDLGPLLFESRLDLVGLLAVDAFLDRLGRRVDEILGLLEAESGQLADDLDHRDLVRADLGQGRGELGLLLGGGGGLGGCGAATAGRRGSHGHRRGRGHAEAVFELLLEIGQLEDGHLLERLEQLVGGHRCHR